MSVFESRCWKIIVKKNNNCLFRSLIILLFFELRLFFSFLFYPLLFKRFQFYQVQMYLIIVLKSRCLFKKKKQIFLRVNDINWHDWRRIVCCLHEHLNNLIINAYLYGLKHNSVPSLPHHVCCFMASVSKALSINMTWLLCKLDQLSSSSLTCAQALCEWRAAGLCVFRKQPLGCSNDVLGSCRAGSEPTAICHF